MNVKSRGALHGFVQQFVLGVGDDELKGHMTIRC